MKQRLVFIILLSLIMVAIIIAITKRFVKSPAPAEASANSQQDFVRLRDQRGNPVLRPTSHSAGDDLVASFQRGIANLEQRKSKLFTKCTGSADCVVIKYDIKKTDSLVMPIVGIVNVKETPFTLSTKASATKHDFQFAYQDGKWTLEKYEYYFWNENDGDSEERYHYKYTTDLEKSVQECFNAE
jgi:hypothetical protein